MMILDAWVQSTGTSRQSALPIPNDLALKGLQLGMQDGVFTFGALELSNGLFEVLDSY